MNKPKTKKNKIITEYQQSVQVETQLIHRPIRQKMKEGPSYHNDEDSTVFYEKIKPLKVEPLDIAGILADYRDIDKKTTNKKVEKEKRKADSKMNDKNEIKQQISKGKKFSPQFISLSKKFRQILMTRFQGQMHELFVYRRSMMSLLFNSLCYGFQEFKQKFQNNPQSQKVIQQISNYGLMSFIKYKVFQIDQELVNKCLHSKIVKPTLHFKSQWKYLLQLLKKNQNSKLRQAILTGQLLPKQLVYAGQNQLKQYLPKERQKQIESNIRNALIDAMPWEIQKTEKQDGNDYLEKDFLNTDSLETVYFDPAQLETDSNAKISPNKIQIQTPRIYLRQKQKGKRFTKVRPQSCQSDETSSSDESDIQVSLRKRIKAESKSKVRQEC